MKIKKILIPLLVLILIPILVLGVSLVLTLVKLEHPWKHIPADYSAYVRIDSLTGLHDEWLAGSPLRAILQDDQSLSGFESLFRTLGASGFASNQVLRTIADTNAHIVVGKDDSLLIIIDLGWRSALTRVVLPFAGTFGVPGLARSDEDGIAWFSYGTGRSQPLLAHIRENLLYLSFERKTISKALALAGGPDSLFVAERSPIIEKFSQATLSRQAKLSLLVDGQTINKILAGSGEQAARFGSSLVWNDKVLLSASIDEKRLDLHLESSLKSGDQAWSGLWESVSGDLPSLARIPESAYFYTAFRARDSKILVNSWAALSGADALAILKQAEDGARTLFGVGLDQLLWSWFNGEAGIFYLGDSREPVVFLGVNDVATMESVLQRLDQSLVLDIDKSLLLDGVAVNRIALPEFFKALLGLMGLEIETPYFMHKDGFIYFSMQARNLARLEIEGREGKLLQRSLAFKDLVGDSSRDASFFVYYDLDKTTPFYLNSPGLHNRLLRKFNRGIAALYPRGTGLDLRISGLKTSAQGLKNYARFPMELEGGLLGEPAIWFDRYANEAMVAWLDDSQYLRVKGLSEQRSRLEFAAESAQLISPSWESKLSWTNPKGQLFRVNLDASPELGFPLQTTAQTSVKPLLLGSDLLFFSRSESRFIRIDPKAGQHAWGEVLNGLVLHQAVWDGKDAVAWSIKDFESPVYLAKKDGSVLPGWPVNGGGISLSGPTLFEDQGQTKLAFLSQEGVLSVWNKEGQTQTGFPVELEGTYHAQAQILRSKTTYLIAVISTLGQLSLYDKQGQLLVSRTLRNADLDAKLVSLDLKSDLEEKLFVYGGKNTIDAFDRNLEVVEGFPLAGYGKPQLLDLDRDNNMELVTWGFEGRLYVYSFN